jgi:hypothetical protein
VSLEHVTKDASRSGCAVWQGWMCAAVEIVGEGYAGSRWQDEGEGHLVGRRLLLWLLLFGAVADAGTRS